MYVADDGTRYLAGPNPVFPLSLTFGNFEVFDLDIC
jgi:hypothetical protein